MPPVSACSLALIGREASKELHGYPCVVSGWRVSHL